MLNKLRMTIKLFFKINFNELRKELKGIEKKTL